MQPLTAKTLSAMWRPLWLCSLLIFILMACGSENEESPSAGLVVLNEISCHGRDWIEIVNTTQSPIDISNWYVSDNLYKEGHEYPIPDGTLIQPEEHFVVKQEKDLEAGFSFGLKCGEDTVYLLDADKAIVDEVELGNAEYGTTWGHLPDITGVWRQTYPTEGTENQEPPSSSSY